ncbi:DUF4333 domain-containing protein [Allosaccharopolyspora coralli]|uniref:DUF4333 domain-containing protein n=1 Tax=Allosaccharopolyspora coralli TaxID=2665642 RepID=UPI001651F0AE|nr:DUF4333 domain-containing protein [Allosaccharopolyspora coralli]
MSNPYGPQWPQQSPGGPKRGGYPSGQPGAPAQQGWGHAGLTRPVPANRPPGPSYGPPQVGQPWPGHDTETGFTVPPPQKRSPWPWILCVAGALVVVVLLVTGFVAPGFFVRTTFDAQAVQQGVRQTFEGAYGISGVESVTCPSGQRVEPGATFDCEATVAGSTLTVTITVKDRDGTYEVGHPR